MQTRGRHALTIKNWSDVQERVRAERTGVCFQIPSASGKSPDTAGVRVPTWQAVVRAGHGAYRVPTGGGGFRVV